MVPIIAKKALQKRLQQHPTNKFLGLVPTMGALHAGHASLIAKAVAENTTTVVSIFVNPTQFNNADDLEKYPKTLEDDLFLLAKISSEIIVFTPTVQEMYGQDTTTKTYDFKGLDTVMEGAYRGNHFNGVGTIVENLFRLVTPDNAYFGEKDFQQLRIIQQLTHIQDLPVNVIGCPIVREAHGLAMSSRNERLSPTLRQKAGCIFEILNEVKLKFEIDPITAIYTWVKSRFEQYPDLNLEYFEITDVATLTPVKEKTPDTKYRAFIAVFAGEVRLIDNIALN